MTANDYQAKGYKVSLNIEQAIIDAAENESRQCYILPTTGGVYDQTRQDHKDALMALAYIGICQRQIFATRSGGKEKNTAQSYTAQLEDIIREMGHRADALLNAIGNTKSVVDIYCIYFNTNFINL